MEQNLVALFTTYLEQEDPPIIILESYRHEPVGALYLNKLNLEDIIICENTNKLISDKYYIYSKSGISVYFTYHRQISGPKVAKTQ